MRGCREPGVDARKVFETAAQQHHTGLSMAFFKARLVELRERGYTILEDFADPTNEKFLDGVRLPFDRIEDDVLRGRSQLEFFNKVFSTLDQDSV